MNDLSNKSIKVSNAGLVLLSPYLPVLFERLKLLNNHAFESDNDKIIAARYLQYAASGSTDFEEPSLALNKVLCGLDTEHPIENKIEISEEHKNLMEGMLTAIIANWRQLGNTSIAGLREIFLMREALLKEDEESQQLIVEAKKFDVLLNTLPYSYSMIKHPWMKKPLSVKWA